LKILSRHNLALAAVASLAVLQSLAQQPGPGIAHLTDMHGNVLVSTPSGLSAGSDSLGLAEGTRIITTNKATTVVVYESGCKVQLKENQRFLVVVPQPGRPCSELLALAQSILQTPEVAAVATTAGAGLGYSAVLPLAGALTGLAILQKNRENQAVSPS
jgi:hypothetical protein